MSVFRYAITDGRLSASPGATHVQQLAERCAELARQGVNAILVREKKLPAGDLASSCREVLASVRAFNQQTKVLVAQRADIAVAVGADGVHLSAATGELSVPQARILMPQGFVSVSCHTLAEVSAARDAGASTVLFGPIFGKRVDGVDVTEGVGLDMLRQACAAAGEMPVLALGGVGQRDAPQCMEAGAAGVAAIRMFFPC